MELIGKHPSDADLAGVTSGMVYDDGDRQKPWKEFQKLADKPDMPRTTEISAASCRGGVSSHCALPGGVRLNRKRQPTTTGISLSTRVATGDRQFSSRRLKRILRPHNDLGAPVQAGRVRRRSVITKRRSVKPDLAERAAIWSSSAITGRSTAQRGKIELVVIV